MEQHRVLNHHQILLSEINHDIPRVTNAVRFDHLSICVDIFILSRDLFIYFVFWK